MSTVTTLITDFDNTLYDWAGFHIPAFTAMLDALEAQSGIPRDRLIREFRAIHQRHGTSEYAFSIDELPSLQEKNPGQNLASIYSPAINAYRLVRGRTLSLYTGVLDALERIRRSGCTIVIYTESLGYYSKSRIKYFGLDGLIDYLYSPPDHDLPDGLAPEQVRRYASSEYELKRTIHRHTPVGVIKPSEQVLLSIISEVEADPDHTLYVGDSLLKDVLMAHRAEVPAAWAKYGEAHQRDEYDLLRSVTHWTDEMVKRERELRQADVQAQWVLKNSFSELFDYFTFDHPGRRRALKD